MTEPLDLDHAALSASEPPSGASRPSAVPLRDRIEEAVASVRFSLGEQRHIARAARERRRFERGEVRRFTKRSRRRRLVALAVAGSLVGLAVVVALAAFSPLMAVRTIEVSGTARVDASAVASALADQEGVPLTLVDRAQIGRELGAFPLIQSYSVQTRPPGTLVVSIIERTPIGVVPDGSRFDLVDAAGVVIETADTPPAGYPRLSSPSDGASGVGFRATAAVLRTLPAALQGQVTAASATTGDDVTFTLANGATVVWGGAGDSALKAVVLEKLMAATDPSTVASYDVSSPQAAVVARRG
ncbi:MULTISPECIES: FtsQ-type POTRA domain-containing protein [unclassified Rathayibacter]|uniref:FtsQ-type POTRA domain-containing protein n=1 Tax=unclassified Rathayibacter TaxID=2609250 RepID=UPI00188B55EB|nr:MULTISPECIES: FtsQ-type POTRA domain-containing protein [unclassified Rathayibacter]MBF4462519.1 FtsQ-type POTRA domain-containing protein [Rathayibacter sp. VKM Ac-2879]MBF4503438.1 FtsQ-type POTRA domain-containing protein [Rathayibacter sp. VKM Ac-2878]